MPKVRNVLRTTHKPPTKPGWYAYSHDGGKFEAVYLGTQDVQNAQDRYEVCLALDLPFVDIWSTRKLKKREHYDKDGQ